MKSEKQKAVQLRTERPENTLHNESYPKGKPPSRTEGKLFDEISGILHLLHNPFLSTDERYTYQRFFHLTVRKLRVLAKGVRL